MIAKEKWIAKTTATGFCILAGKGFTAVAERHFDRKPTAAELSELHDNAHLLAAAPKLLEACKKLLDFVELYGDERHLAGEASQNCQHCILIKKAKNAIKQAEGV